MKATITYDDLFAQILAKGVKETDIVSADITEVFNSYGIWKGVFYSKKNDSFTLDLEDAATPIETETV